MSNVDGRPVALRVDSSELAIAISHEASGAGAVATIIVATGQNDRIMIELDLGSARRIFDGLASVVGYTSIGPLRACLIAIFLVLAVDLAPDGIWGYVIRTTAIVASAITILLSSRRLGAIASPSQK